MPEEPVSYVRYSDDVEFKQPDEEKLIEETIAAFDRVRALVFEKHRHAVRDVHAKSHGILKGELRILDGLPEPLAQGLFHASGTYPVIVRFSTAPGDILPDGVSAFRGMAIKVIGVEGRKVLDAEADALTQDFLLVNHPVIPTGDVAAYLKEQLKNEKLASLPEEAQKVGSTLMRTVNAITEKVGIELNPGDLGLTKPQTHILGETFFSMAAHRYGDYIAKINAVPISESLKPLIGQHVDTHEDGALRNLVVAFFRENFAQYELQVQLCTNLEKMPVEDASVRWDEEESPYIPVAILTLPAQEAFSPVRRAYVDEKLTFNPWHTLPEHRPLGSIQRVRVKAYEASTRFRHEMNAQPRIEPRNIDELPD